MRVQTRRWGGLCAAVTMLALGSVGSPGTAYALDPPDVSSIPLITPADPAPAPAMPMRQSTACATSATLANSALDRPAPANLAFGVDQLHQFATGAGVKVAVIDSGVTPNRRLPRLTGGGDYIGSTDGLQDCDHHGTLVAGIIAAQPSPDDGFVGVAPGASLISIRQTSAAYEPANSSGSKDSGSSTLSTLAKAVTHAANMGAKVINLSVTACYPESKVVDSSDLAEALRYASTTKDAVIVTSAGNTNDDTCKANPGYDPANAADAANWAGVQTISMPSYYSPLVISVGGADLSGQVYPGTMTGPWVDVAAPAVGIVSLDPTKPAGGLTNASVGTNGPQMIAGTSFAAAYVAGLAALIRQRYPHLSAAEVRARIVNTASDTAETQRGAFGHGLVDAVAALTDPGALTPRGDAGPRSRPLAETTSGPSWHWVAPTVALIGVAVAAVAALILVGTHRIRTAANQTRAARGLGAADQQIRAVRSTRASRTTPADDDTESVTR